MNVEQMVIELASRYKSMLNGGRHVSTFLVLVATLGFGLFQACDDSHIVLYVNQTDLELLVYSGPNAPFTIAPNATKKVGELRFSGRRTFRATTVDGRVVFIEDHSWAELKERGWTLTLRNNQQ